MLMILDFFYLSCAFCSSNVCETVNYLLNQLLHDLEKKKKKDLINSRLFFFFSHLWKQMSYYFKNSCKRLISIVSQAFKIHNLIMFCEKFTLFHIICTTSFILNMLLDNCRISLGLFLRETVSPCSLLTILMPFIILKITTISLSAVVQFCSQGAWKQCSPPWWRHD